MMWKVPLFSFGSTLSFSLPGYITLCLMLQAYRMVSGQFIVRGPDHPVIAYVGGEAILPCHLSPAMSAKNMEVRWFRSRFPEIVHLYSDGQDRYEQQMPEYRGRTELLKDNLVNGSVSLRILDIRPSDDGQHKCFFQSSFSYEEAPLELWVAALGSAPAISVEGHQDGGIRVSCRSSGWYPKPEVLWSDLQGRLLQSASEKISEEANGLFQAETVIVLREESNQKVSCHVRNLRLNQERESQITIAEPFFPRVNPWMVALGLILALLAVLIALAGYCFWRQHQAKETLRSELESKRETLRSELESERETLRSELESKRETLRSELESERETLRSKLESERDQLQTKNNQLQTKNEKLQAEIRWRITQLYAVDVTLDPDTAYPYLILSEDRKRVRDGDRRQDLPNNPERFDTCACVLGAEGFTGGRRYWEVEVGDKTGWTLGVCRESVSRKGKVRLSPEDGYWALEVWDGVYNASTSPWTPLPVSVRPSRVGIFLDYEAGKVSFYNVTDRSLLFTFTDTFSGTLRPYFYPGYNAGGKNAAPLIICPVPAQSGGDL